MGKTVMVDLRLPRGVKEDLERRIAGTQFTLEAYINALLTVQVVQMINTEREDKLRWDARNAQLDAERARK